MLSKNFRLLVCLVALAFVSTISSGCGGSSGSSGDPNQNYSNEDGQPSKLEKIFEEDSETTVEFMFFGETGTATFVNKGGVFELKEKGGAFNDTKCDATAEATEDGTSLVVQLYYDTDDNKGNVSEASISLASRAVWEIIFDAAQNTFEESFRSGIFEELRAQFEVTGVSVNGEEIMDSLVPSNPEGNDDTNNYGSGTDPSDNSSTPVEDNTEESNEEKTAEFDEDSSTSTYVPPTIHVTNLVLNTNSVRAIVDKAITLSADVFPANATNKTVTWTSSNPNVVFVDGTSTGPEVVFHTQETGTAIITATADGKSSTCEVTVYSVVLPKTSLLIPVGNSVNLNATVSSDFGLDVQYLSDTPTVVSVDNDGNIRANSVGTAKITVTAGDSTATCEVTSYSVELLQTKSEFKVGDNSTTFTAQLLPEGIGIKVGSITWASSTPGVASVVASTGVVSPVATGTTTITATAGEASASVEVTVKQTLTSIQLQANDIIKVTIGNDNHSFYSEWKYQNGSFVATNNSTWNTTTDPSQPTSNMGFSTSGSLVAQFKGYLYNQQYIWQYTVNPSTCKYSYGGISAGPYVFGLQSLTVNGIEVEISQ